ncbi:MAG TPA: histidine kinase [Usitatibacter sp.]|nr:histidine kinase [Usitatibacter sp.]
MSTFAPASKARGLALMFGWRRVLIALALGALVGLILFPTFVGGTPVWQVMTREMTVALACLVAFGIFEQWPRKLPAWVARWFLQLCAVALVIPPTALAIYLVITSGESVPFWKSQFRLNGFAIMIATGLFVAPWTAVVALFHQRELQLQDQAQAFALERSELERKALDARLRLVQAQVEPHFLFNTLANVRELVVSGSPQASSLLDSLIAYLRNAVPRLNEPVTTMDQELQLVRAYLELMHMRMPDRLQFSVQADAAAPGVSCPPATLLTLVENAIRHGIDPSEEGGRIDVSVTVHGDRCRAEVTDTGVGMRDGGEGLGTGLDALRERLQMIFGSDAQLRLVPIMPHGTRGEIDFPARVAKA